MQDLPRPADLVALAADFLRVEILPQIGGASAFQLRVAINALDLSTRQLRNEGGSDSAGSDLTGSELAEHARLKALLGREGSLEELNHALCGHIAAGAVDLSTPGLHEHLWATTLAKLAVDQPNYASYKREVGGAQ